MLTEACRKLGSVYDVRELLRAVYYGLDKQPLTSMKLPIKEKVVKNSGIIG